MEIADIVSELLASPARISCIFLEDEEGLGINVYYIDGSSYFKPFKSRSERKDVWELILIVRTRRLVELEFDDVLYSPKAICRVDISKVDDKTSDLVIWFINQPRENALWYSYEENKQLADEFIELLNCDQEVRANHKAEDDS